MKQLEAAAIIPELLGGTTEHTYAIINQGAIPWLLKSIQSYDRGLTEQV